MTERRDEFPPLLSLPSGAGSVRYVRMDKHERAVRDTGGDPFDPLVGQHQGSRVGDRCQQEDGAEEGIQSSGIQPSSAHPHRQMLPRSEEHTSELQSH